jgi:hypothetical protein
MSSISSGNGTGTGTDAKGRKPGKGVSKPSKGKVVRESAGFDADTFFDFDNLGSIHLNPVERGVGAGEFSFDFDFDALPVISSSESDFAAQVPITSVAGSNINSSPDASVVQAQSPHLNNHTNRGSKKVRSGNSNNTINGSNDDDDGTLHKIENDIQVARILVGLLKDNPWQYRQEISSESVADLVEQFRERGPSKALEQFPRVTTRNRKTAGGNKIEYILVSGHRRRAAWEIAFGADEPMPVVIKHGLSDRDLKLGGLFENESREELSEVEYARIYNAIINDPDVIDPREQITQSDLARMSRRRNKTTIGRYLKLLNLPPVLQEENRLGRLSLRVGIVLADLASVAGAAEYAYFQVINPKNLSTEQVEKEKWGLLRGWDGWQEHEMPAEAASVLLPALPLPVSAPSRAASPSPSPSRSAYGSPEIKLEFAPEPQTQEHQARSNSYQQEYQPQPQPDTSDTVSTVGVSTAYASDDFGYTTSTASATNVFTPIADAEDAKAVPDRFRNDDANPIKAGIAYLEGRNDGNFDANPNADSIGGFGADFMTEDAVEDVEAGSDEGEDEDEGEEENRGATATFDTRSERWTNTDYDDHEAKAEDEDKVTTSGEGEIVIRSAPPVTKITTSINANTNPATANNNNTTSAATAAFGAATATNLEIEVIERFLRRLQELETTNTASAPSESASASEGVGAGVWETSSQVQAYSASSPLVQLALKTGIGMLVGMCDRAVVEKVVKPSWTRYNPGSPTSYPTNSDLETPWVWVERITSLETLALLVGSLAVEQWRRDQSVFPGRNMRNTLGWLASVLSIIGTEATESEQM